MAVVQLDIASKGPQEMETSKTPWIDMECALTDAADLFRILMMAGKAIEDEDDQSAIRTAAWEGIRKIAAAQEALSAIRAERREASR